MLLADGEIDHDEYVTSNRLVQRCLLDDFDSEQADETAEADWEVDSNGHDHLDYARFSMSWFQLADLWTEDISAEEYAGFLEDVMQCIAFVGPNGEMQLREEAEIRTLGQLDQARRERDTKLQLLQDQSGADGQDGGEGAAGVDGMDRGTWDRADRFRDGDEGEEGWTQLEAARRNAESRYKYCVRMLYIPPESRKATRVSTRPKVDVRPNVPNTKTWLLDGHPGARHEQEQMRLWHVQGVTPPLYTPQEQQRAVSAVARTHNRILASRANTPSPRATAGEQSDSASQSNNDGSSEHVNGQDSHPDDPPGSPTEPQAKRRSQSARAVLNAVRRHRTNAGVLPYRSIYVPLSAPVRASLPAHFPANPFVALRTAGGCLQHPLSARTAVTRHHALASRQPAPPATARPATAASRATGVVANASGQDLEKDVRVPRATAQSDASRMQSTISQGSGASQAPAQLPFRAGPSAKARPRSAKGGRRKLARPSTAPSSQSRPTAETAMQARRRELLRRGGRETDDKAKGGSLGEVGRAGGARRQSSERFDVGAGAVPIRYIEVGGESDATQHERQKKAKPHAAHYFLSGAGRVRCVAVDMSPRLLAAAGKGGKVPGKSAPGLRLRSARPSTAPSLQATGHAPAPHPPSGVGASARLQESLGAADRENESKPTVKWVGGRPKSAGGNGLTRRGQPGFPAGRVRGKLPPTELEAPAIFK